MTYAIVKYTDDAEGTIQDVFFYEVLNSGWIKIKAKHGDFYISSTNVYCVIIKEGDDT